MKQAVAVSFCLGLIALLPAGATRVSAQAGASAAADAETPDLAPLFASPAAWSAERARVAKQIAALPALKPALGKSAASMLAALDAVSRAHRAVDRLGVYATLRADADVKNAANQESKQSAQTLATELDKNTSWLTPEIQRLGRGRVTLYVAQLAELKRRFGLDLDDRLRRAPHTLAADAEGVLAATGDMRQQPDNTYGILANSELPFPAITLSTGEKVTLDQSGYTKYRQVANRADRKKVFDAFWSTWNKYEGTMGGLLSAQVVGEMFEARARHYDSSLSAALFPDAMPVAVYRQLVTQANAALPVLHRYFRLRQRLLGIKDKSAYYDIYPSMFEMKTPPTFSVADSKRLTLAATAPYGPDYAAQLNKGFAGRWMDVLPRPNKRSGAYMNGSAYDVHPYLLLNHNGDYDGLSTFAHEWGHAVHTLLAHDAQPYETFSYSTFIAETASITNEILLNDYMIEHAATRDEKLYYLGEGLELIRGTFFRQTMFAEFQAAIHDEMEKGTPLSGKRLTEMYCGLLKKYHGEAQGVMTIDPAYCIEWAFIPHFYYGFYVYQYATSIAGAAQFADGIERKDEPTRARYIALLKAGGSDYPYNLYRKAGIDMASPAPYQALAARMSRIMDQIDALTVSRK